MPVAACSPAQQAVVEKLLNRRFTQSDAHPREVRLEKPSDGQCGVALVRGQQQTQWDVYALGTKVTEQKRVVSFNNPQRAFKMTQTVDAFETGNGDLVVEKRVETKYKPTLARPLGETNHWTETLKVTKDGTLSWTSTGDDGNNAGFSLSLHEEK